MPPDQAMALFKGKRESGVLVNTCIPTCVEGTGKRIVVPGQPCKNPETLSEKIVKAKRAGCVA
jgi:hypothetical protein